MEHDLGGQLVAEGLAFLARQAGVDQPVLGLDRRVAFIEIDDRQAGEPRQPVAKRAGQPGELALAAARVQWQADDDPVDVVFLDELTIVTRIVIRPAPLVELERKGDRAAGVAHGRANAPRAEIKAEDASHGFEHQAADSAGSSCQLRAKIGFSTRRVPLPTIYHTPSGPSPANRRRSGFRRSCLHRRPGSWYDRSSVCVDRGNAASRRPELHRGGESASANGRGVSAAVDYNFQSEEIFSNVSSSQRTVLDGSRCRAVHDRRIAFFSESRSSRLRFSGRSQRRRASRLEGDGKVGFPLVHPLWGGMFMAIGAAMLLSPLWRGGWLVTRSTRSPTVGAA